MRPASSARRKKRADSSASQSSCPRGESSRSTSPSDEYTTRASGSRKEAGSGVRLGLGLVVIPADAQGTQEPPPRQLCGHPDGRRAAKDDLEQHAPGAGVEVVERCHSVIVTGALLACDQEVSRFLQEGGRSCGRARNLHRNALEELPVLVPEGRRPIGVDACAGHRSRSPPSNAAIWSPYQPGISQARRSSRSTSTSVCVAVTISTSSSTRYAAHS